MVPPWSMKKPEPSEVGAGPGRPGRPRKNSSNPGGRPSGTWAVAASGRWRTEIDTTAGRTRSIRSAKLIGAPAGAATEPGLISWALAERDKSVGPTAKPANKASAAPPAMAVRRRNFRAVASDMDTSGGPADWRLTPERLQDLDNRR